ncbi:MAG: Glycosyl transferase family 39, partial [Berkelbacteria bacterium GW2011_GWB1_38_5]
MTIKTFFQKYWINITLTFIIIASLLLRLWHLGRIGDQIFDEVYFVKFAQNYLTGTSFFDIHPPLGKLIIAFGLKLFGDTSFTWRLMPAIFGTLLIILGYFTGKELSSKRVGLFTASIMGLDGMLLVYSRTGLIDIFLVFFILFAFYIFLKYINTQKLIYLILAGIAVGLAASVKYIGALILIVFLVMIFTRHLSLRKNFWKYFIFLILVPLGIYLAFFLFNFGTNNLFAQVWDWQMQSLNYNIGLKDTHPYGSKWWSWFLLLRPIWLYFKETNGQITGVDGIGNPLSWWSSIIVVPLLIWGVSQKYKNQLIV